MKKIILRAMVMGLLVVLIPLFVATHSVLAKPLPKTIVHGSNVPGTLLFVMGAGFAKVISSHTPMKVEIFPQGGTVWYPMLASGEVHFGLQGTDDILTAYMGRALYKKPTKGKGYPLRTLMLGTPIAISLVVPGDSNINGPEDIKGKRMPVNYGTLHAATLSAWSLLANYGLTPEDVKGLNVTSVASGVRAVIDGRADMALGAVGAGFIEELKAARGARHLTIDASPEAVARMQKVHPGYYPIKVKPGRAGVTEEITALAKDLALVVDEGLSGDIAYHITKALWENYKELGFIHPRLKAWTPDRFVSTHAVVPYHAGSIKLYREKGVWTKEMEEHQKKLLTIK